MFNFYRNNIEDIIDNNINNKIFDKNNLLQLSKLSVLAF